MKKMLISKIMLKDLEATKREIKKFIFHHRIPMPVNVLLVEQDADNFRNNVVSAYVSSLALIKYQP